MTRLGSIARLDAWSFARRLRAMQVGLGRTRAADDPPPAATQARLFTPAFVALTVAELAYFTAEGLSIPVTPLFAAGPLGADAIGVGLSVGAFAVSALLLRPWAGRMADTRGRRPLLLGGALLYAAVMAAHLVAPDLATLIALRLALGVAEAAFFVAAVAAVADLAPPGRTGEAVSLNSLALYLGIAVGPFVGEQLLHAGGFTAAWLGGAGLALAAALIAMRVPETQGAADQPPGRPMLIHRRAVGPGLGLLFGIGGMAGFLAFVALYARELGLGGAALPLLVLGVTVISCRIVFARLPDRVPPFRLGAGALGLTALGLAVVAVVQSVPGLLLGATILGVGIAFTTPAFFAAVVARVGPSERGAAMGTASAFLDLAFGGGPILLGLVAALGGVPLAFGVSAIVVAGGGVGVAVLGRPRAVAR
jgi:predicted MFS family arabinose efflux permease